MAKKGKATAAGPGKTPQPVAPLSRAHKITLAVALIGALGAVGAAAVTLLAPRSSESDALLRYSVKAEESGQVVATALRELNELETLQRFENLHGQNLRAIRDGDLVRSNQLTKEIDDLLAPIRRQNPMVRYLARASAAVVRGAAAVIAAVPALIMSPFEVNSTKGSPAKK